MEYIEKVFKKSGWISILESVIFAILGAILVWKPEETVTVISYILGVIFIIVGIVKCINYFVANGKYNLYNYDLVYGLMAIVIGLVTIIFSNAIISIFRIIIGIWIIYSSFMRMNLSVTLKNLNMGAWLYSLILSVMMFIAGLYVTLNSGAVIVTVGIILIIYSVIDIIEDIIFMKNIKKIF